MKRKILLTVVFSILLGITYGQYDHYLYFTDRDAMTTRYLNVEDPSTIVDFPFTNLDKPYGIVADTVNNYLFVSDATAGKIYRYNFEGTHALTILDVGVDPLVGYPYGLAMVDGKIYWGREGAICRADIDGSNTQVFLHLDLSYAPQMAIGLAYNPDDNMLYFTNDKYEYTGGVFRVNMDGMGLEMILDETDGVGIAIDWMHDKLYYCDYEQGVCMNDYNGANETVIDPAYVDAVIWGITIDMFNEHLYYTDKYDDKIIRSGLDGSNKTDFVTGVDCHALAWYSMDLTNIPDNHAESATSIFPNPATDHINITGIRKYEQMIIMNTAGQLIIQQDIMHDECLKVSTNGWEPGVYFITLKGVDKNYSRKILIR
jgi:hypothetical protein